MDLSAGIETGPALSLPLPGRSSASVLAAGVRVAVFPARAEAPSLQLSSSEELDVESVDAESMDSVESEGSSFAIPVSRECSKNQWRAREARLPSQSPANVVKKKKKMEVFDSGCGKIKH